MALKFGPDILDKGLKGTQRGKKLSAFGRAFKLAYDTKPGSTFTFGGKKYKAIKKKEMKGPPKDRVEDKSITAASIVKGKRDTTKRPSDKLTSDQSKILNEAFKRSAAGVAKKRKAPTPASGKFGQRKAGGIIKAGKGKIILDKLLEVTAPPLSKAGRTATAIKKITGRNKTKKSKEEINKMFDKVKDSSKNTKKTNTVSKIINKYPRTTVGAAVVTAAALKTKDKKRDKDKDKIVGKKRKEKKNISQADIIGKGSKKGRMAGGMMKKYTKGGMNKYNKGSMLGDLNKDGVMSGYEQKRQNAITTAMGNKKMGGGMAKKKMMGGGMMQYSKGTGKKGVTVQARGCGLARKKPTKMS